mmetsp:Transcript_141611/g.343978  ORF Transcript_141611/g.343978 Transcript_141611/m.343978 type:complete len:270 (-) Transcript_141611:399-1208(-)
MMLTWTELPSSRPRHLWTRPWIWSSLMGAAAPRTLVCEPLLRACRANSSTSSRLMKHEKRSSRGPLSCESTGHWERVAVAAVEAAASLRWRSTLAAARVALVEMTMRTGPSWRAPWIVSAALLRRKMRRRRWAVWWRSMSIRSAAGSWFSFRHFVCSTCLRSSSRRMPSRLALAGSQPTMRTRRLCTRALSCKTAARCRQVPRTTRLKKPFAVLQALRRVSVGRRLHWEAARQGRGPTGLMGLRRVPAASKAPQRQTPSAQQSTATVAG